ncbi:MAG: aminoacyl-tRNA hydrolase [Chloroflexota bacterium]|nr:aminoacyl-tRNA hydrolase [Chloroflexota bacterium]
MFKRFRRVDLRGRKLIIGLGNPDPRYAHNRHNVGFQCLDRLAKAHGLEFRMRRSQAALASGEIEGVRVVLAKPLTYMNLSGRAVGALVHSYEVPLADVLVIYDDLDLPLGTIRLRPKGGAGGHKGMLSIIEHLGTQSFPRLRVGIGRPPDVDMVNYVLSDFTPEEKAVMEEVYQKVVAAVECLLAQGLIAAMNEYN